MKFAMKFAKRREIGSGSPFDRIGKNKVSQTEVIMLWPASRYAQPPLPISNN
jgi:hypothetical protein